jgi:CheY-like chemotaxis protein
VSGGRHLLQLINEVLDISRIEAGQLSLSIEPIHLGDVIDEVVALVQPLAAPNQVTVARRIVPGNPEAALADRPRLNQILMNLVSNAVKYNRAGGTVEIRVVAVRNNRVRIEVEDTGMGIAADKHALVFKPFERLGAETTGVEGTGLGLAVSRGLAQAMGGTVDFNSMEDRGSTFWIDLGMAADPPRPAPVAADAASAMPVSHATVLYIEDNPSNVLLVQGLLRQRPLLGLRHAGTAAEGLAMTREHRPDLVLLDLHLPDAPGEDVLKALRDDPSTRSLPVIVATADVTSETARRITALGADAFLAKPLDLAQMLILIDGMLKR